MEAARRATVHRVKVELTVRWGPAARLCLSIEFEELCSILGMVPERGPKLVQRFRSECSESRVMEPTHDIEHVLKFLRAKTYRKSLHRSSPPRHSAPAPAHRATAVAALRRIFVTHCTSFPAHTSHISARRFAKTLRGVTLRITKCACSSKVRLRKAAKAASSTCLISHSTEQRAAPVCRDAQSGRPHLRTHSWHLASRGRRSLDCAEFVPSVFRRGPTALTTTVSTDGSAPLGQHNY